MESLVLAAEAGDAYRAEQILFWVFAVMGVGSGIAMITMRNIVHAALMLVLNLLSIAALYLALQSSFLGIVQVIVYAGAIMVLFLFVIMLLGVDRDDLLRSTSRWQFAAAVLAAVGLLAAVLFVVGGTYTSAASRCGPQAGEAGERDVATCTGLDEVLAEEDTGGAVGFIAERLFTRYTFPFEAAAILLVVATIGAIVLGRRTDPDPEHDEAYAPTGEFEPEAEPVVVTPDGLAVDEAAVDTGTDEEEA